MQFYNYVELDQVTPSDYFWNETMLGNMIPYTPVRYYNDQLKQESQSYIPGFIQINTKEIKYTDDTDPVKLVYSSSSFVDDNNGSMSSSSVLVYQVNKNYIPYNNP